MISSDSYYSLYWAKRNFEKTKQLAQLFEAHTFINRNNDTLRQYTEFPDEAHNIWYKVMAMPEVWDWLFAQKKL